MNTFSVLRGKNSGHVMQVIANYADQHSPYLVPTYKNTNNKAHNIPIIFLKIIIAQNRSVRPC